MTKEVLMDNGSHAKMLEYLEEPLEKQRYRFFTNHVYTFAITDKVETETHIYYGHTEYKPMFNNGLFYKRRTLNGMTYDKVAKKVKFWFGKPPLPIIVKDFEKYYRVDEWKDILNANFGEYYCLSYLNDVVKGKIKSIEDFAIHLTKKSLMFKGLEPGPIAKLMLSLKCYTNLPTLASILQAAENQNDAADWLIANSETYTNYGYYSLPNYARAVGTKINFLEYDKEVLRINKEIEAHDSQGLGKDFPKTPF